jgi:cytochrome c
MNAGPFGRSVAALLLGLAAAGASAAEASAEALSRGAEVYARCAGCHAIEGNRTGPQHCGLFGRRAGTAPGFADYSPALRGSRITWNERELDAFLRDPAGRVPGTRMGYAGVKDDNERAALLAWLKVATRTPLACSVR